MFSSRSKPSEVILEATIIRVNGTVEPQGEIAHYYRNPWKRLRHKLKRKR
jgi:hypothetical protein